jgi:hypothetical protein
LKITERELFPANVQRSGNATSSHCFTDAPNSSALVLVECDEALACNSTLDRRTSDANQDDV